MIVIMVQLTEKGLA